MAEPLPKTKIEAIRVDFFRYLPNDFLTEYGIDSDDIIFEPNNIRRTNQLTSLGIDKHDTEDIQVVQQYHGNVRNIEKLIIAIQLFVKFGAHKDDTEIAQMKESTKKFLEEFILLLERDAGGGSSSI